MEEGKEVVRIFLSCGRFLVWDPRQIALLRCSCRIVGTLIGSAAGRIRQADKCGPPLSMLLEEVVLAVEEGFAEVVEAHGHSQGPSDEDTARDSERHVPVPDDLKGAGSSFREIPLKWDKLDTCQLPSISVSRLRLIKPDRVAHIDVFRELWSRGFFITPGQTFGADYLW